MFCRAKGESAEASKGSKPRRPAEAAWRAVPWLPLELSVLFPRYNLHPGAETFLLFLSIWCMYGPVFWLPLTNHNVPTYMCNDKACLGIYAWLPLIKIFNRPDASLWDTLLWEWSQVCLCWLKIKFLLGVVFWMATTEHLGQAGNNIYSSPRSQCLVCIGCAVDAFE